MSSKTRKDGLWPSTRSDGFQASCESGRTARGHRSLSSPNRFCHLAFVQQIFTLAKARLGRIAADVTHAVDKVTRIPDQTVKIAPLPQFARALEVKVHLPRCESFPAMQQVFQRPIWMRHHQHMNMIWHHDPRNLGASRAVEMSQRIAHDEGAGRLSKDTFAIARIQSPLHLLRKAFVVFHFLLRCVRRWIPLQPDRPFRFPLITKLPRHRVRQTEGDEVSCSLSLPVRQAVECLLNLRVRIEELHSRNDDLWPPNIQPILP